MNKYILKRHFKTVAFLFFLRPQYLHAIIIISKFFIKYIENNRALVYNLLQIKNGSVKMRKKKKLILYILTAYLTILLASIYHNTAIKYNDTFSDADMGWEVIFKEPVWASDKTYCTFPDMEINSSKSNKIQTIQISYSGNETTATIDASADTTNFTLSVDNTAALITCTSTSAEGADAAGVQAFLRLVKYTCQSQSISILLSTEGIPNDVHYFPGTGHFYKYTTALELCGKATMTWLEAYNAAFGQTFGGWQGYLAAVTSEQENKFIIDYSRTDGGSTGVGWLGGTRATLNNIGTSSASFNSTSGGYWYWACGPELYATRKPEHSNFKVSQLGRPINKEESNYFNYGAANPANSVFFRSATLNGEFGFLDSNIPFDFAKWDTSEPNNSGTEYLLTTLSKNDCWNDWGGAQVQSACIIEYGDELWGNSDNLAHSILTSTDIGKPVTINYHDNRSEKPNDYISPESTVVYYNTTLSYALDELFAPAPNYYDTFLGWYTAASGGIKAELTSNVAGLLGEVYAENLNLYAKWELVEDALAPTIESILLTHNDDEEYKQPGTWTNSDIIATYTVKDKPAEGKRSGIDIATYKISLDNGKNWSDVSSLPDDITKISATEDELVFKISREGEHDLQIKVSDRRNNTTISDSKSLKIDKTAPSKPAVVTSDLYSNTHTPLISGTGEAWATVTIKEYENTLGTTTADENGDWETNVSLSDGVHDKIFVTQTDLAGNTSDSVDITLKIDTTPPLGTIHIEGNPFSEFLNTITFGLFFKETVDVTFTVSDSASGIAKTEYLKRDSEFTEEGGKTAIENAIASTEWVNVPDGIFKISLTDNPFDKFIIYARITDNAGNITCINSNGVIVYTDSVKDTDKIVFTKTSTSSINAKVKLNGNTINKIVNSTTGLDLKSGEDYTISSGSVGDGENTIIFSALYLDSLAAGKYSLIVHYNPAGQPFVVKTGNDEPDTTDIELTVEKATQSAIAVTGINSPYTYGDNSFSVGVTGGSGTGAVTYSSSDTSVASIVNNANDTGTVTILKVGTFKITATKATDNNYLEKSVISGDITVNPKPVSILGVGAKDKVYDKTDAAVISGLTNLIISGKLTGDDLTVNSNGAKACFADKNVGIEKHVTFSGFSLAGEDASNYTLSAQPQFVNADITQKPVTISGISAKNKVYDGNTTAVVDGEGTIVNNLDGTALTFVKGTASFGDKTVGDEKPVTFEGFALSGDASSNYYLESQPAQVKANITPKNLTIINLSVSNKPYDGLNVASISSTPALDGVVSGDTVSLINGTPTFTSVDIGNNISISFTNFSLSGADANNYSLTQPSGIKANIVAGFTPELNTHYLLNEPDGSNSWYISNNFIITAKNGYALSEGSKDNSSWQNTLTYSAPTTDFEAKFYVRNTTTKEISVITTKHYKKDSTDPAGEIQIKQNKFNSFLNTITFGLFFKENVEVKISASDTLSGIAEIKYFKSDIVYSNGSEGLLSEGWIDGGSITDNSISFNVDPADWDTGQVNEKFFVYARITDYAGNICYLRSDGVVIYTDSTQYTPSISFTKTSEDSVFASVNLNGNTINTIFNGAYKLLQNDDYQVNGAQIEFKSSYLDKLLAGEYTLTIHYNPAGQPFVEKTGNDAPATTTIALKVQKAAQKAMEITGVDPSYAYTYGDEPFIVGISGGSGDGAVTYSLTDNDDNAAKINGKTITILKVGTFKVTAFKATDDYYLEASVTSEIITVNPKPVTLDFIEVNDKVYDGDNTAEISKNPTITGNIDGENLLVVVGKAFFDSKDAGDNKTVTFVDFDLEGSRVENYTLVSQPESITANISKRPVNILGLGSSEKIYDGNTDAQITLEPKITNRIEGDGLLVKYGKANFSDKNVGTKKQVTFSEFDIIGDQSHNYFLESQPQPVFADINQKGIDIINININSKTYDRTKEASFKSSPNLFGVVAGDDVTLINGIPSFKDFNVSENIPIEFTEFSIDGLDSKNYYLNAQPSDIIANITPKELIIKNLKIKDKIFDGYSTAEFETTPTLGGVIKPDEVILLIGTPTFSAKDVSYSIPIIFTPEFSISGKDSSNYSLIPHSQVSANIDMSEAFNQRDPSTNLWLEAPGGVLPQNCRLVVEKFADDFPGYERILYDLDEDKKQTAERYNLFEIHIVDVNGEIVQPNPDNGLVTVRIPVPDDFDKDGLEMYRVLFDLPDSEFDEYLVTINGNHYCEFKTDHFSPYALVDKKNDNQFIQIFTGGNQSLKIFIIALAFILTSLLIIFSIFLLIKKKKRRRDK
jgi:hypothetical protein